MLNEELIKEYGMPYSELVLYLQQKYGIPKRSFFYRGMKTPVPTIRRAEEGLFIHHVAENKVFNLAHPNIAARFPAEYQEREMLVYCNLLEHFILHLKIVDETTGRQGEHGLNLSVIPTLNWFYVYGKRKISADEKPAFEVVKNDYETYLYLLTEYVKIKMKNAEAKGKPINTKRYFSEVSVDRNNFRADKIYEDVMERLVARADDGCIYTKDGKILIQCENTGVSGRFTVPDGVSAIGDFAFEYCAGLTEVVFPEGLLSVGSRAFYGCSGLQSVSVPETLKAIADGACGYCWDLKEFHLPQGLTEIGNNAFDGCRQLVGITLPEGLLRLGREVFRYCWGLTEITLPSSLKEIGRDAFRNCRNLKTVEFSGTKGWKAGKVKIAESDLADVKKSTRFILKTTCYRCRRWRRK